MGTASSYQAEYEQSIPELEQFLLTGDESDLQKRIQQGIDYNRELRAEQGQNLAQRGEIISRYDTGVDPLLKGMDMSQRERLKSYDTAGNNARAAELSSYMAAREGSVADTIKAWKDAWNTKYQAMSEKQKAKYQLWQMAFDQEKMAEEARQKELDRANTLASARISAAGSGSSSDKWRSSYWDDMSSMAKQLSAGGGGKFAREQIGNYLIGKYGGYVGDKNTLWTGAGSKNTGSIWNDVYSTLTDGWEDRYK